jgi:ABC-type phosphate transport system substrate-binding protein
MRVMHKAAVIGATLVALAGIGAGTALADPPSGVVPASTDIVGVGSDTTASPFNVLSHDYNATNPVSKLWSWDEFGNLLITTKANDPACTMQRPNGSDAGIAALNKNTREANGNFCIDFARSAHAPKAVVAGTNGPDAFAVLAGDAITWSSPEGSGVNSPVPFTLTLAQLASIYACRVTNWDQVGGFNAPIVPVLPQAGSETRATFLAALGGGPSYPLVPGACVVNGANGTGIIEENTGLGTANVAQFDPRGVPAVDDIFPYSIGDYIAQGTNEGSYNGTAIGGHATPYFGRGVLVIHDTTDNSGIVRSPTLTVNGSPYSYATAINYTFTFPLQYDLWDVVRNAGTATSPAFPRFPTSPAYETNLSAIFGHTGFVCTNLSAHADIVSYGFLLRSNCGELLAGS